MVTNDSITEIFTDEEYYEAQAFKMLKGVLAGDDQSLVFDKKNKELCDNILNIKNLLLGSDVGFAKKNDILNKFNDLPVNRQKSILYKVQKIDDYEQVALYEILNKSIKQWLINLSLADMLNKPVRYSRTKDWYSGKGHYKKYKLDYEVFNFVIDCMHLFGIVDLNIGDDGYRSGIPLQTRVCFTDVGRILLNSNNSENIFVKFVRKQIHKTLLAWALT